MLEVPSGVLIGAGVTDAGARWLLRRWDRSGPRSLRQRKQQQRPGRRRVPHRLHLALRRGVTDEGETCDDGNSIGTGCAPGCRVEGATSKLSRMITAVRRQVGSSALIHGRLTDGDQLLPSHGPGDRQPDRSPHRRRRRRAGDTFLRLYRSESDQIVLSDDNSGAGSCSAILPNEEPRARYRGRRLHGVCCRFQRTDRRLLALDPRARRQRPRRTILHAGRARPRRRRRGERL